jgi:hypothetical protein
MLTSMSEIVHAGTGPWWPDEVTAAMTRINQGVSDIVAIQRLINLLAH